MSTESNDVRQVKRDLFAAVAMHAFCSTVICEPGRIIQIEEIAADAVAMADTLLAKLEKRP